MTPKADEIVKKFSALYGTPRFMTMFT